MIPSNYAVNFSFSHVTYILKLTNRYEGRAVETLCLITMNDSKVFQNW